MSQLELDSQTHATQRTVIEFLDWLNAAGMEVCYTGGTPMFVRPEQLAQRFVGIDAAALEKERLAVLARWGTRARD